MYWCRFVYVFSWFLLAATTPKQFGHVTGPTPHKPLGVNAAKSPPSNITVPGAIYRPTSPRTLPKQTMKALPLSPYTPPKSPPNKSKGLEMFLTLQKKLHEPEDDLSEFTDSEDVIPPKPVTIVPPSKPVTPSPVIGRAMPMKVNSQVKGISVWSCFCSPRHGLLHIKCVLPCIFWNDLFWVRTYPCEGMTFSGFEPTPVREAVSECFTSMSSGLHSLSVYYLPRRRRPPAAPKARDGRYCNAPPSVRLSVCLSVRLSVHHV